MIKLSKIGKTNKKVFRLIISEKGRDPYGKALEILGSYNPYSKDLQVKADRVKHWLSKGAGMTETINNLLVGQNIIEGKKVKASKVGKVNEKRAAQVKSKADKKADASKAASTPSSEVISEELAEPEVKTENEDVRAVETSEEAAPEAKE